jgi:hypothetical protein
MLTGSCACVPDPLCWWGGHLDVLGGLPGTRGMRISGPATGCASRARSTSATVRVLAAITLSRKHGAAAAAPTGAWSRPRRSSHDFGVRSQASGCRSRTARVTSVRACDDVDHQHDHIGRLALLINASRGHAGAATAPESGCPIETAGWATKEKRCGAPAWAGGERARPHTRGPSRGMRHLSNQRSTNTSANGDRSLPGSGAA